MMPEICIHLLVAIEVLMALPAPYIVGGTPANISDFPYQVAVSIGIDDIGHVCGGSIISENAILTAAHCCHYKWRHDYRIIAGLTDFRKPEEGYQDIGVKSYIFYPGYVSGDYQHDVCVMKLKSKLVISPEARTALMPLAEQGYVPKVEAVVSGWGLRNENGRRSDELMAVNVTILEDDYCYMKYKNKFKKYVMMCAGSKDGGKDSCQGDSGGPLVDSNGKQVGITSWGIGCGNRNYPGVYADVSVYSKWIKSQLSA